MNSNKSKQGKEYEVFIKGFCNQTNQSMSQASQLLNQSDNNQQSLFSHSSEISDSQNLRKLAQQQINYLTKDNNLLKQRISELETQNKKLKIKLAQWDKSAENSIIIHENSNLNINLKSVQNSDQSQESILEQFSLNKNQLSSPFKKVNRNQSIYSKKSVKQATQKGDNLQMFQNSDISVSIMDSSIDDKKQQLFSPAEKKSERNIHDEQKPVANIAKDNQTDQTGESQHPIKNAYPLNFSALGMSCSPDDLSAYLEYKLNNNQAQSYIEYPDEDSYLQESTVFQNILASSRQFNTPLKNSLRGQLRMTNVSEKNKRQLRQTTLRGTQVNQINEQNSQDSSSQQGQNNNNEIKNMRLRNSSYHYGKPQKYSQKSIIKEERSQFEEQSNQQDWCITKSLASNYLNSRKSKRQSSDRQRSATIFSDKSTNQNSEQTTGLTPKQTYSSLGKWKQSLSDKVIIKSSKNINKAQKQAITQANNIFRTSTILQQIKQKNQNNPSQFMQQFLPSPKNCLKPLKSVGNLKKYKSSTSIGMKSESGGTSKQHEKSDINEHSQQQIIGKLVNKIKVISCKNKQLGQMIHTLRHELKGISRQKPDTVFRKKKQLIHDVIVGSEQTQGVTQQLYHCGHAQYHNQDGDCSLQMNGQVGCRIEECRVERRENVHKIQRKQRIRQKWAFIHNHDDGVELGDTAKNRGRNENTLI